MPDARRVADWIGYHLIELAGVTVPAGLAVGVSPWWLLGSVLNGGLWARAELRAATRPKVLPPAEDDFVSSRHKVTDRGVAR